MPPFKDNMAISYQVAYLLVTKKIDLVQSLVKCSICQTNQRYCFEPLKVPTPNLIKSLELAKNEKQCHFERL